MTIAEFKKKVDSSLFKSVESCTVLDKRRRLLECILRGELKSGRMVLIYGKTWDEVFAKMPDDLKVKEGQ